MDYHHDLGAHHANGPPPLLIWIWVFPRRGHGIVEHEDRGHETEAVRSKVRLVLCLIPSPTQARSPSPHYAIVVTETTCSQHPFGGIIGNGSISAHVPRPDSVAYTATKHAVTGLTKSTSLDGRKYNIACGQIDIGNAATPMTARMPSGTAQADGSMKVEPTFDVEHVASTIVHMSNLPLDTNVQFVTIMATDMPYIGRG